MTLAYSPDTRAASSLTDVMERLGLRMTFAKGEEIFGQDEGADLIHCVAKESCERLGCSATDAGRSATSTMWTRWRN